MPRRFLFVATTLLLVSGCSSFRVDKAAAVAASYTSHALCSGVFISGREPAAVYADMIAPLPGIGLVAWGLRYHVNRERGEVDASVAGLWPSRSIYRGQLGCVAIQGDEVIAMPGVPLPLPVSAPESPPVVGSPRLQAALDAAFQEPDRPPYHHTHAVVLMQDGHIIAERYAPGFTPDMPLPGFSLAKSVSNALLGILVRQGRLRLEQSALLPQWRAVDDERARITVEELARQTSGLDVPQTNSGFDATSQIMNLAHDKIGAIAEAHLQAEPGCHWHYSDTHYQLLSRLLANAVGGTPADFLSFAHQELFAPLGMRHVTVEFDATGTPMGANSVYASARDWARLGQLYLDGGQVGGQRILPADWVRFSTTPTLDTGYGAGWWANRGAGLVPGWGVPWGLAHAPADSYFGRGYMGQYVVVVPSRRLVLVRLSAAQVKGDDIAATDQLVEAVLQALDAS